MCRPLGIAAIVTVGAVSVLQAQVAPAVPRLVDVDNRPMRVWIAGVERRNGSQPAVILEAGAGEGLDNWKPVFAQIAISPVVAYDRRGLAGECVSLLILPGAPLLS
jgi:hypothetical protein